MKTQHLEKAFVTALERGEGHGFRRALEEILRGVHLGNATKLASDPDWAVHIDSWSYSTILQAWFHVSTRSLADDERRIVLRRQAVNTPPTTPDPSAEEFSRRSAALEDAIKNSDLPRLLQDLLSSYQDRSQSGLERKVHALMHGGFLLALSRVSGQDLSASERRHAAVRARSLASEYQTPASAPDPLMRTCAACGARARQSSSDAAGPFGWIVCMAPKLFDSPEDAARFSPLVCSRECERQLRKRKLFNATATIYPVTNESKTRTFDEWLADVDQSCRRLSGFDRDRFEDVSTEKLSGWFSGGMAAEDVAREIVSSGLVEFDRRQEGEPELLGGDLMLRVTSREMAETDELDVGDMIEAKTTQINAIRIGMQTGGLTATTFTGKVTAVDGDVATIEVEQRGERYYLRTRRKI